MKIKKEYLSFIGVIIITGFIVFVNFYIDAINKAEILTLERDYYKASRDELEADILVILQNKKDKE